MKNNNDFLNLFEKRLSEYTGAPYVVLMDSCTNAIFLSLKYYSGISLVSSNLLIPEQTYVSVPQSLIHAGFTPIYNNKKWKSKYRIGNTPIFDCAVGFKPKMYKKNTFMCLSFQQKKALPIGKGGAILLDNKEAYKTLKRMAFDGRDASIPVKEDNNNIILGYHMNMTPDQAAKGILLLNQYQFNKKDIKSYKNYPNISGIKYEKNIRI